MESDIPVSSIRTTFDIIQFLSKNGSMRFSDIAERLEYPKSTVYDHLQSLKSLGYLNHTKDKYEISFEFLLIGDRRRSNMQLFNTARTELDELASAVSEHVSLVVTENGMARTIYTTQGENTINFKVFDGTETHLARTGPGRAILANFSQEGVEDILDQHDLPDDLERYDDQEELLTDLNNFKRQGYATDQEAIQGMKGVGVPIIDGAEIVRGAVSVYGPVNRMDDEKLKADVLSKMYEKVNIIELNLNLVALVNRQTAPT